MRAVPLCLLLAVSFFDNLCSRPNPVYCDDSDPALRCPPGQACLVTAQGGPSCQPTGPGCTSDPACPDSQPICDSATKECRACASGEDTACAMHNPKTPRCLGPTCVACISPGAQQSPPTSQQAAECAQSTQSVCDVDTNQCRGCRLHAECASGACVKDGLTPDLAQGTCVPSSHVLTVDPEQACQASGPIYCTPADALNQISATQGYAYVIIRHSIATADFAQIEVSTPGVHVVLVGPLADGPPTAVSKSIPATLGGDSQQAAFTVDSGCDVTIEGFYIEGSDIGVYCYGSGVADTTTRARVLRSVLSGNLTAVEATDSCHLSMTESWVGQEPASAGLTAGGNGNAFCFVGADFDISNTVIFGNSDPGHDIFGGVSICGLGGGGASQTVSTIVNSLFYDQADAHTGSTAIYCNMPGKPLSYCPSPPGACAVPGQRLAVLNSLFLQPPNFPLPAMATQQDFVDPLCGGDYSHLGTDEQGLGSLGSASVIIKRATGPGFVSATAGNFHLPQDAAAAQPLFSGGAVSLSVTGTTVSAPTVDMDEKPRPIAQGHVAIGPYEPTP